VLISPEVLTARHGVQANGVLHLGAHRAEEYEAYTRCDWGETWWVEGNPFLIGHLMSRLSRTVTQQRTNHVIHALLGEHDLIPLTLNIASNGESSSVLALGTHATEHPEVTYTGERFTAFCRSVDSLVREHDIQADFLNLDLQGYELLVLRGAVRFLASQVRWVYTEVNESELYQSCALLPEVDEYLDAHGFDRVAIEMTRHGWGDACYARRDQ
jgi:FkbM family methyltransferase